MFLINLYWDCLINKSFYTVKIIIRLYNGVYYKRYKTILGTKGRLSIDKYSEINEEYKCKLTNFVDKTKVNFE